MFILIARYIDTYILGALCWLLIPLHRFIYLLFYRSKKNIIPKRFLFIRLRGIGSTILTFPAIKQLINYYGDEKIIIDFLVTSRNKAVMQNQSYAQHCRNIFSMQDIFSLIKKYKYYDIVIDSEEYFSVSSLMSMWLGKKTIGFSNLLRRKYCYTHPVHYNDQQHVVITFLDLIHKLNIPTSIPKQLESIEIPLCTYEQAQEIIKPYQNTIKFCFHTAGAETSPERFRSSKNRVALIQLLRKKYGKKATFFLSGTAMDEPYIHTIQSQLPHESLHILRVPLFTFCATIALCDIMISNDTGPMHISAAMGIPTIGLFGPNLPIRFGPYPPEKHCALYHGDGIAYINVHKGSFISCSQEIIDRITPKEVVSCVEKLLGR